MQPFHVIDFGGHFYGKVFFRQIEGLQFQYQSKVKGVKIVTISCNGFWGSFLWEGFSREREVIQLLFHYSEIKGVKITTISCNGFWGSFLWEGFCCQTEEIQLHCSPIPTITHLYKVAVISDFPLVIAFLQGSNIYRPLFQKSTFIPFKLY